MTQASLPIAVTIGDPHGIGPEIAVKAAVAFLQGGPRVILVGDRFIIEHYRRRLFPAIALREAGDGAPGPDCIECLPVEALHPDSSSPARLMQRQARPWSPMRRRRWTLRAQARRMR